MNTTSPLTLKFHGRVFLVPIIATALTGSAVAQQSPYQSSPAAAYQSPPPNYGYPQQRPSVGARVGGFVRRMFYGESAPVNSQPPYGYQPGRSLDSLPSAPSSRYESPAPAEMAARHPETSRSAPSQIDSSPPKPTAPKTTASTAASSGSKYTPPKIKPDAPPPAPKSNPTPAKTESAPPAPKSEPTVEQNPPTPKLDNTPTPPASTVASMNQTLPSLDIPAIKQPAAPASSPAATPPPKEPPAPSSSGASSGQFLVGKKTAVPGRVISPYPPYQELDVSGLASGSLALDPTTDKVFEIP